MILLLKEGKSLRIFIGEKDRYKRSPLYEWIVQQAQEYGLAGATVLRGVEGFGASGHIHTAKILSLSIDLPLIIEIIYTSEKIEAFLLIIEDAIKDCITTSANVNMSSHRNG